MQWVKDEEETSSRKAGQKKKHVFPTLFHKRLRQLKGWAGFQQAEEELETPDRTGKEEGEEGELCTKYICFINKEGQWTIPCNFTLSFWHVHLTIWSVSIYTFSLLIILLIGSKYSWTHSSIKLTRLQGLFKHLPPSFRQGRL